MSFSLSRVGVNFGAALVSTCLVSCTTVAQVTNLSSMNCAADAARVERHTGRSGGDHRSERIACAAHSRSADTGRTRAAAVPGCCAVRHRLRIFRGQEDRWLPVASAWPQTWLCFIYQQSDLHRDTPLVRLRVRGMNMLTISFRSGRPFEQRIRNCRARKAFWDALTAVSDAYSRSGAAVSRAKLRSVGTKDM